MGWQDADRSRRSPAPVRPNVDVGHALAIAKALVAVGAAALYGIVWVGYEEFYDGLDLTPEEVGLGQPTIVSRAAVLLGILFLGVVFVIGFALVAYRMSAPVLSARRGSESRVSYWSKVAGANLLAFVLAVLVPVATLRMVASGPMAPTLASLIVTTGGFALEVAWLLADPDVAAGDRARRVVGQLYPGRAPRVGALLVTSVVGIVLVAWASNFLGDAAYAGKRLRSTGVLPANKVVYLNVGATPARIHLKGGDPLEVCQGGARALLLRRHNDVTFVLLVRDGAAHDQLRSEVARLHEDDYMVVAASDASTACNPGVS